MKEGLGNVLGSEKAHQFQILMLLILSEGETTPVSPQYLTSGLCNQRNMSLPGVFYLWSLGLGEALDLDGK